MSKVFLYKVENYLLTIGRLCISFANHKGSCGKTLNHQRLCEKNTKLEGAKVPCILYL